ncbi:hypothetical protein HHK36_013349 [Tetracentron sinense]|uniref:Rhodanese domain-containing protein n=1 Tax=Tetracentron sinense TaxID=13715 RepID=A0A835DJK6_TETSI|nr:hypothetical protein HHK36_013349 [Tetracentron sinense]
MVLQISLHAGLRSFPPSRKAIEVRCIMEDRVFMGTSITQEISFKSQATKSLYTHVIERPESGSMEFINIPPYPNELDDIERQFPNKWNYSTGSINEPDPIGRGILNYVESSNISTQEEELMDLPDQFTENTNILSGNAAPETISTFDATSNVVSENLTSVSDSLDKANDSLPSLKTNIEDFLSGVNESISGSVDKGEHAVKSSLDEITSSLTYAINSATEAVDNAVKTVFSTVDQTGELAGNGLTSFSSDLKEATSKAGFIAIDVLRRAIVAVEDYVASGTTFVLYSYGSAKELLPTEVRNVLNLSEEKAIEILRPVGTAFKQVYVTVEGLEKNLGLDPTDPIIPFVLFLGTSTTLGISYWVLTYGGYSGDLSPQSTLELLTGEEKVVLIDVRPEARDCKFFQPFLFCNCFCCKYQILVDLRERDGIPDLRRGARFKYASVTLPEIDGSVKGLVKSGRDLNDALIAAVIRNLKIIPDRSQIIVMDADGTRSKGIARSLRKFGVKASGFRSWVTNGLRVKELKPETTLTILNERNSILTDDLKA